MKTTKSILNSNSIFFNQYRKKSMLLLQHFPKFTIYFKYHLNTLYKVTDEVKGSQMENGTVRATYEVPYIKKSVIMIIITQC